MLALRGDAEKRSVLVERRGLSEESIDAALIGWSTKHQRYTIPVFDEHDRCVGLRLYAPDPAKGQPKMKGLPGYGNRLYVPGDDLDPHRRTLYCAGEWDALMAVEHGWQAVTHTGGEGAHVPEADRHRLAGMDVIVVYDADEAGQKGAQRVAEDLQDVARSVAIAQLPDDLGDKGDLSDLFNAGRGSELRAIVGRATAWDLPDAYIGSWAVQELQDVLADSYEPETPTICRRIKSDVALFYPGRVHALISESEAGKTWLALHAAHQELEAGRVVYYLDFEDTRHGVVRRLISMGCPPEVIERGFRYIQPDEAFKPVREAVLAALRRDRPSLVVVDGVTEAMVQNSWKQNANDEIAEFFQILLRPMAATGAAVVMLDHLPKSEEGSAGRGAIGGVAKLNGIDGAAYRLKPVRPIVKGREGLSRVTIDKDRPGEVKRHQDDKKGIADLIVDSDEDDGVQVFLALPTTSREFLEQRAAATEAADAETRTFIETYLRENPGATQNAVKDACHAKGHGAKEKIGRILEAMRDPERFGTVRVESGPNNSKRHYLADMSTGVPVSGQVSQDTGKDTQ
ncbi:AAA family ATPase [Aeromicrobium sp. PE09-221]|uniref:AAA family ATPase n=1 Tax=Aeromicrobium sp. PE09-221 TaxID=1898043 RepID=UPI001483219B|nr:AAA family ATPase [Aeromicrobium sp. PE09-221]